MQVLRVLSFIWKSGAEIYRDESDGRLALKNANQVPKEVLEAAGPIFDQIDAWYKSWENESAENITIRKMIHHHCGWQENEKLNQWLLSVDADLIYFDDWMCVLARNGWKDIYEDYRQYENDESNKMKKILYERAISWASRNK